MKNARYGSAHVPARPGLAKLATLTIALLAFSGSHAAEAGTRLQQQLTKVISGNVANGVAHRPTGLWALSKVPHGSAASYPLARTGAAGLQAAQQPTPAPATLVVVATPDSSQFASTPAAGCNTPVTSSSYDCGKYTLPNACDTSASANCYKTAAAGAACTTTDAVYATTAAGCTPPNTTVQFCRDRTYAPACVTTHLPGCTGQPTSASQSCVPFTSSDAQCTTQANWCQGLSSANASDCAKSFVNNFACNNTSSSPTCELTFQVGCMNTNVGDSACTSANKGMCALTYGNNCATNTSKGLCHNPSAPGTPAASLPVGLLVVLVAGGVLAFRPSLG